MFKPAAKPSTPLRLLLSGPAGSGKSLSALRIAEGLGARIAAVDTECGSLSHYADYPGLRAWDVATVAGEVTPDVLCPLIESAAGYDVLILDSLSHLWRHLRDQVDMAPKESEGWRRLRAGIARIMAAIHASPCHVIATVRTAQTWTATVGADGRPAIALIGGAPDFDAAATYEFDTVATMSHADLIFLKCRTSPLLTGTIYHHPGAGLATMLAMGCSRPATAPEAPQATQVAPAPESPTTAAPMADSWDDAMPVQTSSLASIAEARAACGAAVKRGVHTEDILDTLAVWCGLTPEGKILTVPAERADLDALLSDLRGLGVSRG